MCIVLQADVCTYEDICYDGRVFYFFAPGGCKPDEIGSCQENYGDADLKEGLIFPAYGVREAADVYFPFNGGACFLVRVLKQ